MFFPVCLQLESHIMMETREQLVTVNISVTVILYILTTCGIVMTAFFLIVVCVFRNRRWVVVNKLGWAWECPTWVLNHIELVCLLVCLFLKEFWIINLHTTNVTRTINTIADQKEQSKHCAWTRAGIGMTGQTEMHGYRVAPFVKCSDSQS